MMKVHHSPIHISAQIGLTFGEINLMFLNLLLIATNLFHEKLLKALIKNFWISKRPIYILGIFF
jgi:hypothetical protein